jgi:hypothetical protein
MAMGSSVRLVGTGSVRRRDVVRRVSAAGVERGQRSAGRLGAAVLTGTQVVGRATVDVITTP